MWKSKYTENLSNKLFIPTLAILALFALGIRSAHIAERPFHCDEAVQAIKFGKLLEEGAYQYDPEEYHGPTLYYLSLPATWLLNQIDISQVNESELRFLPALFGAGIILLLIIGRDGLGRGGTIWAALLTAVSPFMVYYSRYYIQETILIFFAALSILSGWRYYKTEKARWMVLAGIGMGMMFATKETCIISWFSFALAFLLTAGRKSFRIMRIHPLHVLIGIFTAAMVVLLFFSSFGTHPEGILQSVSAYTHYFTRAAGEGHQQPWHHYMQILFWHRSTGILWSELLIGILATTGAIASHLKPASDAKRLPRFLSYYTIAMIVIYSAIPYKTPWLVIGFLQPAIMLAGYGAATILIRPKSLALRAVLALLLIASTANLAYQTYLGSFRYFADDRNPCVYSHTSTDAVRALRQIRQIALLSDMGRDMPIKIISPEYWPLPWYLRDFTHVGYWHQIPSDPDAPIVITTPNLAEQISQKIDRKMISRIAGLRPGVLLQVLIDKDLWDKYIESLQSE